MTSRSERVSTGIEEDAGTCPRCGEAGPRLLVGRGIDLACEPCREEIEKEETAARSEAQNRKLERRAVERREHIEHHLAEIGVNVRVFGERSFETFDPDPDAKALRVSKRYVEAYLEGKRPGLYLYSPRDQKTGKIRPGNGKTHLAVSILRALLLDAKVERSELAFVSAPRFCYRIRDSFGSKASSWEVIKAAANPELLVLDDLGAENLSPAAAEALYLLLDERQGKATVVTANLSLEELEERDVDIMPRIVSRLVADAAVVQLNGPDRRLER